MSTATKRKVSGGAPSSDPKKPKVNASITSFFGQPKVTPAASHSAASSANNGADAAAPKFDKDKWVAGLTPEQKNLLQLEIETLHDSWLAHLKDEVTSKEFLELKKFLEREKAAGKKIFPPREDIYSWSRHTPFPTVKVVILGQDPYHNHNQAHGLAFSVRPPTPAPPSLRNMYICLKNDYPTFKAPPKNAGLLTPWADRGVLLLNTCLTVRAHEANSHANRGWEKFTQRVIDLVATRRTKGVVFMAWGTPAGKRVLKVDAKRHLVLKAVHPSPLSASRGFFDCGHFKKANEWLVTRYGSEGEIDWDLDPTKAAKISDGKENGGDVPPPVIAVGEVKVAKGGVEETSKVLEKDGEEAKLKVKGQSEDEEDLDEDEEAAFAEAAAAAEAQSSQ